ncbi:MAG: ABC transporter substrate-binding protein [Pseudomonadota bacterium]
MRRRDILAVPLALGMLMQLRSAGAQPASGVLAIAILDDASEDARPELWKVFSKRLAELGYVEGKNLRVDKRYAGGVSERLGTLAAEAVARGPAVIVVAGTPSALAARRATGTIPIVIAGLADPVGVGLVASLARPGGNVTGLSIVTGDAGPKWLDLLREIAPAARRIAFLTDASNKGAQLVYARLEEHARRLNVAARLFDGREQAALEQSLDAIARERFGGLIVSATAVLLKHRDRIVRFAAQARIPALYGRRDYADAGGLLSYAAEFPVIYARAADYVDRIARGAKPSELPVEQPNIVRMVTNLKAARALGINVPQSILLRSDEVIE